MGIDGDGTYVYVCGVIKVQGLFMQTCGQVAFIYMMSSCLA